MHNWSLLICTGVALSLLLALIHGEIIGEATYSTQGSLCLDCTLIDSQMKMYELYVVSSGLVSCDCHDSPVIYLLKCTTQASLTIYLGPNFLDPSY